MSQTYTTLGTLFTAIANAIRAKTGGSAQIKADDFPTEIANIPTGGGTTISSLSVTQNGTYTAPAGTAYTPVTVNVGGSVIPSDLPNDGKTRICYEIPSGMLSNGLTVTLSIYLNTGTTITLNWGDGSADETYTGSGRKTYTHDYTAGSTNILSIKVTTGSVYFGGSNQNTVYGAYAGATTAYGAKYIKWAVIGSSVTKLDSYAFYYCTKLQEIRFPTSGLTSLGNYVFAYCANLKNVVVPNTVTSVGTYTFSPCASLESVTLPDNTSYTTVGNYTVANCSNLKNLVLPNKITTINQAALANLYTLESLTLPSNLTTIDTNALQACRILPYLSLPANLTSLAAGCLAGLYSLRKLRFNSATPPTASASTVFTNLPTTCIISVPTGKKSAYTSAANYPSSSTYTYIEEAS